MVNISWNKLFFSLEILGACLAPSDKSPANVSNALHAFSASDSSG